MEISLFRFPILSVGWGKTSLPNISDFANILQEAETPIVDYTTCAAGNINLTYAKVDDEVEVCSGYGGNSAVSISSLCFYLVI